MKIALIHTPLWGRGGAERQLLMLAIELQKLGNEVEVFTPQVNEKTCYPDLLKQVMVNTLPNSRLVPFKRDSHVAFFDEKVNKKNFRSQLESVAIHQFYTSGLPAMVNLGRTIPKGFDIINNHNPPTQWAAFIAKQRLKIPVVWMCNEPPSWYWNKEGRGIRKKINWPLFGIWDKISVRYIDKIVALSHVAEALVRDAYNKPSRIVRTGFSAEKFQKISGERIRKKYNLENQFILLQVANLSFKRQADSIKALYYLSKNHHNVKLVLDGAGAKDALKTLSEKLGVTDKVLFLHSECDKDLAELYAACDVFVFPHQITWGLAVVEAMASMKPVVVSKGCGVAEIIEDNVNGLLVENGKPEEIAKKVETLIADSILRMKIGKNAAVYVKENLSWQKYAVHMEEIFRQVLVKAS